MMHTVPGLVLSLALFAMPAAAAASPPSASPTETPRGGPSGDFAHGDLRVSPDRRFLVHADGTPFVWIGDTAWELFHRLTREEAERYLDKRRAQGFTVVQAVALAELDGLDVPNAYGHRPFVDRDPERPDVRPGRQDDYWDHVDAIVRTAEEKGLYVGLLPTWGDKVGPLMWGKGPVVFSVDNARAYGRWLGERYRSAPNVVWILGGDRPGDYAAAVWRAMAEGLRQGDGGRHLATYHPWGGTSSAVFFHKDEWLAFNMFQSGHGARDLPNHQLTWTDYNREPIKPVLDGEPRYENHPIDWNPEKGWFDDTDTRQAAYWSLFAGAFGHTYGCHDVWQMNAPGREPISSARNAWTEVLDLPGAWDMMHVRSLLLSRPFLGRVPDQSLVAGSAGDGADHVRATRAGDGSYAFLYLPTGRNVRVDLGRLGAPSLVAWWFDPRTGAAQLLGDVPARGTHEFDPPGEPGRGNDWILVIDHGTRGFGPPGAGR